MSRVGKKPIELPSGVKVDIIGNNVTVQGPKGTLKQTVSNLVTINIVSNTVTFSPISNSEQASSDFGTTRALVNNMILGVTTGFKKGLELQGVGFVATVSGQVLTLKTGYSHEVKLDIPTGATCTVEKNTSITVTGFDKQVLGNFAANIRKVCPPEPYLGKGIRYSDEKVRRKAGKTGGK